MPSKAAGPSAARSPTGHDDTDLLARFATEHGQALLRFAFLLTGGRAEQAEDLVQAVLLKLAARDLTELAHPRAYARQILLNEYRGQHRRTETERRKLRLLARDSNPPADTGLDQLVILDALTRLTHRERAVIVLRYYEDLPDAEIATLPGCSRPTVRSLAHRALPKLRTLLEEAPG